jgi:hypothetical protein
VTRIPRRLSTDDAAKDPRLAALVPRLEITLDGVRQTRCVGYDLDAGEILRFAADEEGRLIPDGDRALMEVVRGKVRVRVRP